MEILGSLKRCAVLGLVTAQAALPGTSGVSDMQILCNSCATFGDFQLQPYSKKNKIFRGISGHPWQIANGSIRMVPHRSGSMGFFHTNILCAEFSCSSALNNDYKHPLQGTGLAVIQKFVGYFRYSSSTATKQHKQ